MLWTTDKVPRSTPEEAKARLDSDDNIVILDVRRAESYERRRIRGAISIPFAQLRDEMHRIPKQAQVITY
ncbi:MAG: rhodanese-like domain-containing protein [Chloroflexi bacterium]|nr:rhodanese-like domain-containing protein [Chloroflexota bacterium]